MTHWKGKRAVVVGGSKGLGAAIAKSLADAGADVLLAARDATVLEDAVHDLNERSTGKVTGEPCDALVDDDVARLTERAVEELGGIDLWVNAAGQSSRGALADTSLDELRRLWELNFLASARCSLSALRHLQQSRGHLVCIGSLAAKFAPRWLGAYPTSKFPLAAFCQQLRLEQRENGVHVLLVCPGPIARNDGGSRYAEQSADLPSGAAKPGGGAKVRALDPNRVADKILAACRKRRSELVLPAKARLLTLISAISPAWGDWLLRNRSS